MVASASNISNEELHPDQHLQTFGLNETEIMSGPVGSIPFFVTQTVFWRPLVREPYSMSFFRDIWGSPNVIIPSHRANLFRGFGGQKLLMHFCVGVISTM